MRYFDLSAALFVVLFIYIFAFSSYADAGTPIPTSKDCPNINSLRVGHEKKVTAMVCMVNYARQKRGVRPFQHSESLRWAAKKKSADILRCGEFSHNACGRPWAYWARKAGFAKCVIGENLAGGFRTVRAAFVQWMKSRGHRFHILNGSYNRLGTDYARDRSRRATWTMFFARCR